MPSSSRSVRVASEKAEYFIGDSGRRPDRAAFAGLAIERRLALPFGEMTGVVVPVVVSELEIGAGEFVAEALAQHRRLIECPQRIEKVERQPPRILYCVPLRIHVDVEALAGVALV